MTAVPAPSLLALNTAQEPPSSFPFTLLAPPKTDLWVKPTSFDSPAGVEPVHSANQPSFLTTVKLSSLIRASVTFSFVPTVLYDQAGLVLLFSSDDKKWIKAGLEYYNKEPKRGIVVTAGNGASSDWSMTPPVEDSIDVVGRVRTTVEIEREEGGTRSSLFVKVGEEMIREVTWVYGGKDEEVKVGFYGARPLDEKKEDLEIVIEGWELETK